MREVVKRRVIWVLFIALLVSSLFFVLIWFFLPAIVGVQELESAQVIKKAITSGVVLGTLATIMVLIIGAIIADSIVARRHRD